MTTGSVKMTRYSPRFFFFLSRFYGTKVYHNSTVRTTSYDQEVFLGQNQVSDLFCGDDGTKLNFFCICSQTFVMSKYLQRPLQASSKIISGTDHSWIYPMSPVNQEVWWLRWLSSFFLSLPEPKKMENAKWDQYFSAHFQYLWTE